MWLPDTLSALVLVREWGIIALLVVLEIAFSIWGSPVYGTLDNANLILGASAISAIFAAAIAVGVMSGSLDLSVPGTSAFAGIVVGKLVVAGTPPAAAIVVGLLLGVAVGIVNGLLALTGINALAVTIGTLSATSGLAAVFSAGVPIEGLDRLHFIGTDHYLSLSAPVWVVLAVYVVGTLFLTQTRDGIRLLAAGGNAEALERAGVNAGAYRVSGFAISGTLAALGGIVTAANTTEASPAVASDALFVGLTAVALSGVPLTGGRGSLPKVFVGAVLIASISSILVIKDIQPYWSTVITGVLLIMALAGQVALFRGVSSLVVLRRGIEPAWQPRSGRR